MRTLFILLRRELASSFLSIGYYLLLGLVAAISGFFLHQALVQSANDVSVALIRVNSFLFWLSMILAPLLTMRLFADEKSSGSLELLMTAPVRDWQVVFAKYFGAVLVFTSFFAPFWLAHFVMAGFFEAPVDWGQLTATTLGFTSIALVHLAIGLMASALISQQLWAALLAFLTNMAIMFVSLFRYFCEESSTAYHVFAYIDLERHLRTAASGLIDLRQLLFQVSVMSLMLFWTIRVVEVRKWR